MYPHLLKTKSGPAKYRGCFRFKGGGILFVHIFVLKRSPSDDLHILIWWCSFVYFAMQGVELFQDFFIAGCECWYFEGFITKMFFTMFPILTSKECKKPTETRFETWRDATSKQTISLLDATYCTAHMRPWYLHFPRTKGEHIFFELAYNLTQDDSLCYLADCTRFVSSAGILIFWRVLERTEKRSL